MQRFSRKPGAHGPVEEGGATAAEREVGRWGAVIAGGFLFGYDAGVVTDASYTRQDFGGGSFRRVGYETGTRDCR
ncbi:hypothetical protein [Streptomyces sulphureus]|uniref:hypothetical protein n=1 Tax=Streptomyces sulphureus TaxID=47758 RepID=UPI0003759799|nr:hypothetical protein [Streptomyces sulphureus]